MPVMQTRFWNGFANSEPVRWFFPDTPTSKSLIVVHSPAVPYAISYSYERYSGTSCFAQIGIVEEGRAGEEHVAVDSISALGLWNNPVNPALYSSRQIATFYSIQNSHNEWWIVTGNG